MNEDNKQKTCSRGKIMPWALVLIGVAALLADLNILTWAAYNIIWPILLIIVGIAKMSKKCKNCQTKQA